jgi:D-alanyl-D-alanine dipeptidase
VSSHGLRTGDGELRARLAGWKPAVPLLLFFLACAHQPIDIPRNEHGLAVVGDLGLYERLVVADPSKELVDLEAAVPGIVLDIRYATPDNFMKQVLYPSARAFLRRPAAEALARVQQELRAEGLGLKVYDAYRPYRVTKAMWEPIQNPDYVADPKKGSRHNRGAAVDVTLISLATGEELAMPTEYDAFVPAAAHDFSEVSGEMATNRARLRAVMTRHGFEVFPSEWWHYDFKGWERFEIMDLPFEVLKEE